MLEELLRPPFGLGAGNERSRIEVYRKTEKWLVSNGIRERFLVHNKTLA
jgi:hypothetical protein